MSSVCWFSINCQCCMCSPGEIRTVWRSFLSLCIEVWTGDVGDHVARIRCMPVKTEIIPIYSLHRNIFFFLSFLFLAVFFVQGWGVLFVWGGCVGKQGSGERGKKREFENFAVVWSLMRSSRVLLFPFPHWRMRREKSDEGPRTTSDDGCFVSGCFASVKRTGTLGSLMFIFLMRGLFDVLEERRKGLVWRGRGSGEEMMACTCILLNREVLTWCTICRKKESGQTSQLRFPIHDMKSIVGLLLLTIHEEKVFDASHDTSHLQRTRYLACFSEREWSVNEKQSTDHVCAREES